MRFLNFTGIYVYGIIVFICDSKIDRVVHFQIVPETKVNVEIINMLLKGL